MRAFREQRRLARASRAKIRALWRLLRDHCGDRSLVFTDDNDTAYAIGRNLVLPVLTHHTRVRPSAAPCSTPSAPAPCRCWSPAGC